MNFCHCNYQPSEPFCSARKIDCASLCPGLPRIRFCQIPLSLHSIAQFAGTAAAFPRLAWIRALDSPPMPVKEFSLTLAETLKCVSSAIQAKCVMDASPLFLVLSSVFSAALHEIRPFFVSLVYFVGIVSFMFLLSQSAAYHPWFLVDSARSSPVHRQRPSEARRQGECSMHLLWSAASLVHRKHERRHGALRRPSGGGAHVPPMLYHCVATTLASHRRRTWSDPSALASHVV